MEDKDNVPENSGAGSKGFKLFSFGKDGSSLPRHLGSSGFTCSIICFILSFCYYTFLTGWQSINKESFAFKFFCKVFGAEKLVAAISNAAAMTENMRLALWVMGISGIACFISGFFGCISLRIAKIPVALLAALISFLGAAAFIFAAWRGFDCWYLGVVPCTFYGLSGIFALINSLR